MSRKALRRSLLATGVSVALLAAAFAGYGAWTRHGDVRYARGGQDFLAPPQVTASQVPSPQVTPDQAVAADSAADSAAEPDSAPPLPSPQVTAHDLAPDQVTARQPVPSAAATATPGARTPVTPARPSTTRELPTAPRPLAAPAAAVAQPAPGRYGLRVEGTEDVKFGPLSFCGRTFPADADLVVAPAVGEPAGSFNFDVRYYPGDAGKHDERHIYRYTRAGVEQGFESATVTCGGVRQSSDVAYSPVQSRVRLPLTVGQTWSGKGGDADRTETYRTRVTGTDTLAVAGERVPVYVIETETQFTGAETGTRVQRWWYSPAHAMPLRWSDRTKGGRSGATYTSEVTVSVVSLPPAEPK